MFDAADRYALLLSLLAGLATSVGGLIAVWRKPDQKLLAFLLGTAVGVMATLSVVELYVKNVLENGFVGITLATACGAMVYVVVEPLLPKTEAARSARRRGRRRSREGRRGRKPNHREDVQSAPDAARALDGHHHDAAQPAGGFAVAFSSYTSVGPVMAAAIGVHNVPEGIIVAAPVFAATGSRRRALLMATVSASPSPRRAAGAVLRQAVPHADAATVPARRDRRDDERGVRHRLLPEGRKCRNDAALARGVLVGTAVMLGTLYAGV